MKKILLALLLFCFVPMAKASQTWYVLANGGTRTQCDGLHNATYSGSGTNQPCAFGDARWLWDDQNGHYGTWVIAGGDTIIFTSASSIAAVSGLVDASTGPAQRIGYDYGGPCSGAGCGAGFTWCQGTGSSCGIPPPPAGTPGNPTKLWGANHGSCSTTWTPPGGITQGSSSTPVTQLIPDVSKMFEFYGDYGVNTVLDLRGTHDIDVECVHISTHGTCIIHASTDLLPNGPEHCATPSDAPPLGHYASEGIRSTTSSADLALTDVWISGMQDSGWFGPITNTTATFNDVRMSYCVMTGFNMDDDSVHSQTGGIINATDFTIDFNGFNQAWPYTTAVPVKYLSTQATGGDGDGCATPGTSFDTFNFTRGLFIYNGQDGCDVGHNQDPGSVTFLKSIAYGNLGGTFKSGGQSAKIYNSYSMQNCFRVQQPITGVPTTAIGWNTSTADGFDYCRAGDGVGVNWLGGGSGEVIDIANSTIITYGNGVDFNIQGTGACTGCTFLFRNNIGLAYSNPNITSGHNPVFFPSNLPTSVTNNNIYNFFGYAAGSGDIVTNTNLTNQPNPAVSVTNSFGDAFNLTPTSSSPGNSSAPLISGITTDIFGATRSNPTSMGAQQFATATTYFVTPTPRVMAVGDLIPPCDVPTYATAAPTVNLGAGSAIWSTPPTCTVNATSSSPVGTYTITVNPGVLVSGTVTYNTGTLTIEAPNGNGANLVNAFIPNNGATAPPTAYFSSVVPFGALEATSNYVANMVGDGVTENWDMFQNLIATNRGAQTATVTCSGAVVTASSGAPFTGLTGVINLGGLPYTISSIGSATQMTLTTTPTTCTGATTIYLPRMVVAVTAGSPNVTLVSGPLFTGLTIANEQLQIGTQVGKIATVNSGTSLTLNTGFPLPNITGNTSAYIATDISGGNGGGQPTYIHIPCGKYNISHVINTFGGYMNVVGNGKCTELYLPPNSPDYNGSSVLQFISGNPVNQNDTFHVYFENLWIHIGVGNPKAIPFQFPPSNYGAARNLLISSDDGLCVEGINLGKSETGPGLLIDDQIDGCSTGLSSSIPEYDMTAVRLTIQGQSVAGVQNNQLRLHLRNSRIVEPTGVPALTNTSANASLNFQHSEIFGNGGSVGITNSSTATGNTSAIYLNGITVNGYTTSLNDWGSGSLVSLTGNITEYATGTWQSLFDSSSTPSSIPIAFPEAPTPNDPAVNTWGVAPPDLGGWNASLAACTSSTWMIPPGAYGAGTSGGTPTITVPDCINHIQGFHAMDTPGATWHATFVINSNSTTPLIFSDCPQAQCAISHTGTRQLVMQDFNNYNYVDGGPGTGTLWCEDCILGGNTNTNNSVTVNGNFYANALNMEQVQFPKLIFGPNVQSVIFGLKNEHNGANVTLNAGDQVNIFGITALGDPLVQGSGGDVATINSNASFFMFGTMSTQCTITQPTNPCNNAFYYWLHETRNGVTLGLPIPNAQTIGQTENTIGPIYSFGAGSPSAPTPFYQGNFLVRGTLFK